MTSHAAFARQTGLALIGAGALTIIVNAVVPPSLPRGVSFADVAASHAFLWRQSLSALAAILLMLGSVGLYLRQIERSGWFGTAAFVLAFAGSALLFGVEWTQIFEVRDMALRAPATLNQLDAGGVSLADLGAMIAFGVLATGWLALAVSTLRSGLFPRRAAWLVIAGLFATPLLHAALPALVAVAAGNAILGSGWIWLGSTLSRGASIPVEAGRSTPRPAAHH